MIIGFYRIQTSWTKSEPKTDVQKLVAEEMGQDSSQLWIDEEDLASMEIIKGLSL